MTSVGLVIFSRSVRENLSSPGVYGVVAVFAALSALLFTNRTFGGGTASLEPSAPDIAIVLIIVLPVLTMRLLSEGRRASPLQVLFSMPVSADSIVIGQYTAAVVTSLLLLATTLPFAVVLALAGDPDLGKLLSTFLGLALLSLVLTAIGVAASALASTQAVAASLAIGVSLSMWFAATLGATVESLSALRTLSLADMLSGFLVGRVTADAVVRQAVIIVVALWLARCALRLRMAGAGPRRLLHDRGTRVVSALAALLVLLLSLAGQRPWSIDMTSGGRFSLTTTTTDLLERATSTIELVGFPNELQRPGLLALLEAYEASAGRIRIALHDPDQRPDLARRYGISDYGDVVVLVGGATSVVKQVNEATLTQGIADALRSTRTTACFSSGQGERSLDDRGPQGLIAASGVLAANGVTARTVSLVQPDWERSCDVVVVAGPQADLPVDHLDRLSTYLRSGGDAVLLVDGPRTSGLAAVTRDFGVSPVGGVVVEPEDSARFEGNPLVPSVSEFESVHPVVQDVAAVALAHTGRLELAQPDPPPTRTISLLAQSSPSSVFLDQPNTSPGDAQPGPAVMAVAVDDLLPDAGAGGERTRLAVVASADMFGNQFIDALDNSTFLVNALAWAAETTPVVGVRAATPEPELLDVDPWTQRNIVLALVLGQPFLWGLGALLMRRRQ